MTVRIGLTGPIGCGKSTVAGWLAERPGVVRVDADQVARDVMARGEPALEAVYERFGRSIEIPDGGLDRAALGQIVFDDPAALRDLEAIVHPAVRPRILAAMAAAEGAAAVAIVIEAIKLIEGGLAEVVDEIWLVTCIGRVQHARLVNRGTTPDDANRRVAAQAGLIERATAIATRVIDSSGEPDETRSLVSAAFEAALRVHR